MKTLLVPVHDDDVAETALGTACALATRFQSYIEGLYVRPLPQIVAGEGITVPGAYVTQPAEDGQELAEAARARFESFMSERGIPLGGVGGDPDGPAAGWRELEGLESLVVAEYGRLFDLIVVGRRPGHTTPDWSAMCEGALFESGRPVLVSPGEPEGAIGEHVVVAWNGSTETARTIGLAMPVLARASRVLVLSVEGGTVSGPSGEQVASHLARNGVAASERTVPADGRSVGEVILEQTGSEGADLLLKGAYTQSRLRQMIFGGATRHILSHAALPVLLAH